MSTPPSKLADRIDKWLWAVRFYKTRPLATEACKNGMVLWQEQPVKPSREAKPGEILTVRQGVVTRTIKVLGVPRSRVGAKEVASYCEESTPASEWEKAREQKVQHLLQRERGSGRPTKRDRRELDRLFEG